MQDQRQAQKLILYLNNSDIGSPEQALGYGTLHKEDKVGAISVILTFRRTVALLTVHPYQIRGTCESYWYGEL